LGVRHGALNLHPSLLPRHRGAVPIPATILAGDPVTGVTLIQMDAGLDTGPIVATDELALSGDETTPDLERILAARGATLLGGSLRPWVDGSLTPRPQPVEGATLTRQLHRDDGRLDTGMTAEQVARQVRALQPWPGSWLDTSAGRLVVWAVRPWPDPVHSPAGTFRRVGDVPVLDASDGTLELLEVQPAGGRRMSGSDFIRGRPEFHAEALVGAPRPPIERAVG
jgi:methionyl-tRNA formyltransferase